MDPGPCRGRSSGDLESVWESVWGPISCRSGGRGPIRGPISPLPRRPRPPLFGGHPGVGKAAPSPTGFGAARGGAHGSHIGVSPPGAPARWRERGAAGPRAGAAGRRVATGKMCARRRARGAARAAEGRCGWGVALGAEGARGRQTARAGGASARVARSMSLPGSAAEAGDTQTARRWLLSATTQHKERGRAAPKHKWGHTPRKREREGGRNGREGDAALDITPSVAAARTGVPAAPLAQTPLRRSGAHEGDLCATSLLPASSPCKEANHTSA